MARTSASHHQSPAGSPSSSRAGSIDSGRNGDPIYEQARAEVARYRRLRRSLQEDVSDYSQGIRKARIVSRSSNILLGRGIRRLVSLFDPLRKVVTDADRYNDLLDRRPEEMDVLFDGMEEEEIETAKREWQRGHTGHEQLTRLIPNFQRTVDTADSDRLTALYTDLEKGSNDARGDDIKRAKEEVANWLNAEFPDRPLLDPTCRLNRGIQHDTTGFLLCPIEYNWDDEYERRQLRGYNIDDGFDFASSFFCRCFYAGYRGNAQDVENGFLRSRLLVKMYKAIFTSPTSAKDVKVTGEDKENINLPESARPASRKPKTRKTNAALLNMENKVTPRSIAYTCVQLHLAMSSAPQWTSEHAGFNYKELYEFIIDFFEDPSSPGAKQRADRLLKWWNRQIFSHISSARSVRSARSSRSKLKRQQVDKEQ